MNKHFVTSLWLLSIISCNFKNEDKSGYIKTIGQNDTVVPGRVQWLTNLPDSLKPKSILLENTPKPQNVVIPDRSINYKVQDQFGSRTLQINPPEKVNAGFSSVMQNYTTEDGLAVDVISCSYADKKGNLWFGTFVGGVSKYDGKTFTSYSKAQGLVNNEIQTIIEDRNGNMWFGTKAGISIYDGISFTTIGKFKDVNAIYEDRAGTIWFGCLNAGLYEYSKNTIKRHTKTDGLSGNDVYSLTGDKKGNLWIGTENGICKYDGIRFVNLTPDKEWLTKQVRDIFEDKRGNIWAGTFEGFVKYDGISFTNYRFVKISVFAPCIHEDRFGNIWFSNAGEGVTCLNGNSMTYLNKSHGLTNSHVTSIIEDRSGNLWFSTDAGISKYSGAAITNYTQAQGLVDNSIRSIMEDFNGDLWFASNAHGISRYDGEYFINYNRSQGLSSDLFWCIYQDKSGAIWMGTWGEGLIKFDGKSFTTYTVLNGLADNVVRTILQDSKGNLWFGTQNGISKFDGKSITNYKTSQGLANNNVWSIFEDKKGRIWIGTEDGVSCFDGRSFTNYFLSETPGNNHIKSILEDKAGNLWFATFGGGLCRFDGKSFYAFTTEQGLPDNTVTQAIITNEGYIAIGTNFGMAILTGFNPGFVTIPNKKTQKSGNAGNTAYPTQNKLSNEELRNYSPVLEIYNSKTGYPVKDVNRGQNAMFLDSKGIIWIATGSEKSGLVRFNHSELNKNTNPPDLNLTAVKIGNENVCWNDLMSNKTRRPVSITKLNVAATPPNITEEVTTFGKILSHDQREVMKKKYKGITFDSISKFYPIPQNLVLPYSQNNLTIEFVAIEPAKPSLVKYQYQLVGYDKEWSSPSNITTATFGNIFEGNYQFKLRAKSPSGIWSKTLIYTFRVLPPLYRAWWAYILYIFSFLFALRIFSKWRERELIKKQRVLEDTVKLRTAEVVAEKKEVEKQRERSDELLLNILPAEVAEELKDKGTADAKHFEEVTVMFTDFKDFTRISEKLTPSELVAEIHTCFQAFDHITTKFNIEKIKTIGDSYMCVGGLPNSNTSHPEDMVKAAFVILEFIENYNQEKKAKGDPQFEIRIGINTGPVVAGIVGVKKFAYDIWGDTVNIAARLETKSEAGRINISGSTYERVKNKFNCLHRGKIEVKGKGEVDMYFVEQQLPNHS